jgi:hypothetical protein
LLLQLPEWRKRLIAGGPTRTLHYVCLPFDPISLQGVNLTFNRNTHPSASKRNGLIGLS